MPYSGKGVGIIGSCEEMRKIHLFQSQVVNSTDITIYPSKKEESFTNIGVPSNAPQACANRFKLYIDYDGSIYPCFGLIGLHNQAIGSIREAFSNCALAGQPYTFDLISLALKGPELQEENAATRFTSLPWICERHRSEIIKMEYTNA
ncbi:hypothetical protein [Pseudanabaena sp. SR411]|uniref:hypothetical protein n=1 Tax=Pseudanabaena sp. SR411 TaxID=1980935 RepID=UPI00114023D6|nr:hypothetical protein [Pseudanabaena sp. SR411]